MFTLTCRDEHIKKSLMDVKDPAHCTSCSDFAIIFSIANWVQKSSTGEKVQSYAQGPCHCQNGTPDGKDDAWLYYVF